MDLDSTALLIAALMLVAALLYSSVGHAGASGYLAVMALAGVAPATMKPTALALNIVVAVIATWKFQRAGAFSWRLFAPLAVASVPLAYLGGRIALPSEAYRLLVGAVLVYAAVRTFVTVRQTGDHDAKAPSTAVLVLAGGALGFLAGLTGVGGGIFLSPLLLFLRWAPLRTISGVSAAFILVNSIAGLLGAAAHPVALHPSWPLWAVAVVIGGVIGAGFGSRRLGNPMIQRLLAAVLLVAGLKMIATAAG